MHRGSQAACPSGATTRNASQHSRTRLQTTSASRARRYVTSAASPRSPPSPLRLPALTLYPPIYQFRPVLRDGTWTRLLLLLPPPASSLRAWPVSRIAIQRREDRLAVLRRKKEREKHARRSAGSERKNERTGARKQIRSAERRRIDTRCSRAPEEGE